jgi:hypothetical protein
LPKLYLQQFSQPLSIATSRSWLEFSGDKIEGWRKVRELLEAAGYKIPTKPEIRGMNLGASTINISEIKFEKSDYAIGNLVTVFTLRLEIPTEKIVDSEPQDQEPKD